MARIRSIHPPLFTDEGWVSCSPIARVLYVGLLTDAEDQGIFEWKPLQLKMRLLPADNVDTAALLDELSCAGLIAPFNLNGKSLGAIHNFCKWQSPRSPSCKYDLPHEWRVYVGLESAAPAKPKPAAGDLFQDIHPLEIPQNAEMGAAQVAPLSQNVEMPPQREDGEEEEEGKDSDSNPESHQPPSCETADRRASRLPSAWVPDEADLAYAVGKGMTAQRALEVGEDFRDYWVAKAGKDGLKADWHATWQTWVRKELKWAQTRRPAGGGFRPTQLGDGTVRLPSGEIVKPGRQTDGRFIRGDGSVAQKIC